MESPDELIDYDPLMVLIDTKTNMIDIVEGDKDQIFAVAQWMHANLKQETLIQYVEQINLTNEHLANELSRGILQLMARDTLVQAVMDESISSDIPVVCPTKVFVPPEDPLKEAQIDF